MDGSSVVEFFHGEVNAGYVVHLPKPQDSRCTRSAALTRSLHSLAGVRLGMKKTAYARLLGKPSRETASIFETNFHYVRIMTNSELASWVERNQKDGHPPIDPETIRRSDVYIAITAVFVDGRLTSFEVDRAEQS